MRVHPVGALGMHIGLDDLLDVYAPLHKDMLWELLFVRMERVRCTPSHDDYFKYCCCAYEYDMYMYAYVYVYVYVYVHVYVYVYVYDT